MVYIGGDDPRVVDGLTRTLAAAGHPVKALSSSDLDPGDIFELLQCEPGDLVLVEPLPRLAGPIRSPAPLAPLVGSIAAAAPARLVLVTGRAADDPELAALRRSGASYLILRVDRLIDLAEETAARLRGRRRIVVPAALAARAAGAVLPSDVGAATAAAIAGDACGSTIVVAPADGDDALNSELARIGARPARSRVGAALWRVAGAPRLAIGSAGALELAAAS